MSALAGLAMFLFLVGVSGCGKPKPVPVSKSAPDFHTLFRTNCSGCHGNDGKDGPGRPLNDPFYLALIPKDALENTIEHGRPGTAMPAFAESDGGPLNPDDINALVSGIEREWAKPVNLGGMTPPPYRATNETGDPVAGKQLFSRDCFACHGSGAPIGPVTDAAYLSLVSDQWLRSSIIAGRQDRGMPDWRRLNMGRALSNPDINNLVAYLVSLRPMGGINKRETQ
ncbi:MAG: c-type cytochrome [Bryobacteraceae bacterium]